MRLLGFAKDLIKIIDFYQIIVSDAEIKKIECRKSNLEKQRASGENGAFKSMIFIR